MQFILCSAMLMLLTACTPTVFTSWQHPGKTAGQFALDSHICESLATKHTTPQIPGYKDPCMVVTMDGSMDEELGSQYFRCISSRGWKIRYQIVGNFKSEEQLDEDLKRCEVIPDSNGCMTGKGWTVVDHSPWLKANRKLDQNECTVQHSH